MTSNHGQPTQTFASIGIETGVVKFLHWGDHAASNDYREYNKVILSTFFYRPPAYYDAMARLSMGHKSEDPLTREQRDEIDRGEHADAIVSTARHEGALKVELRCTLVEVERQVLRGVPSQALPVDERP